MSLESLLVNRVDLSIHGAPINVGGANVPDVTVVTGVACSIQESGAAPRSDQDIEGSTASGKAFFASDPGLSEGDTLTWTDGGNRVLIASGRATNAAGRGVLWRIRWTEIS